MLRAALRRIVVILAGAVILISVVSLPLGVAFGASAARSESLGLTIVGCFLLISGFFVGNRGPVRVKDEDAPITGPFVFGNRIVRWATPSERDETINLSAVLVSVGFTLILIGLAADPRYRLI